jgi:uncharacterized protein DUF3732
MGTFNTSARNMRSLSSTRRRRASIFETPLRLMSKPASWSHVARVDWAQSEHIASAADLGTDVVIESHRASLSEIGSGSNWLAYHIATILALQQFFMKLPHSPVPQFVVFDQPSQVYFSKKLAGRQTDEDPKMLDEDVDAIRKAFIVFDRFVSHFSERFQIIVLDHAPDAVWGTLPATHLVEEWRNGPKLVPIEWLQ